MDINTLVGMSKEDAIKAVQAAGLTVRVTCEDGKKFHGDCSARRDRVNLELEDGKVTKVHSG